MQVSQNSGPNFTSVIPVRVYGKINTDKGVRIVPSIVRENIMEVQSELMKILELRNKTIRTDIISKFDQNVGDYYLPAAPVKCQSTIRSAFKKGLGFLFTGNEAKEIYKRAKKFGPIKHLSKERANTTESLETALVRQDYSSLQNRYINLDNKKLKTVNPKTKKDEYKQLNILADISLVRNSKGEYKYKVDSIKDIEFTTFGDNPDFYNPIKNKIPASAKPVEKPALQVKQNQEKQLDLNFESDK